MPSGWRFFCPSIWEHLMFFFIRPCFTIISFCPDPRPITVNSRDLQRALRDGVMIIVELVSGISGTPINGTPWAPYYSLIPGFFQQPSLLSGSRAASAGRPSPRMSPSKAEAARLERKQRGTPSGSGTSSGQG